MKLYDFYQSSAAYRVRIAVNLKGITVEHGFVDLTKAEQRTAEYARINPQLQVPSLVLEDGTVLTQSLAILEYLDEAYPDTPALVPSDLLVRAHARALALAVAADIAPINNLKIRKHLAAAFKVAEPDIKTQWIQHWILDGFAGIERLLAASPHTGGFCIGDRPTIADCCLMPQLFNAGRWGCDLAAFPTICRMAAAYDHHPAFIAAHPFRQPDAPKTG